MEFPFAIMLGMCSAALVAGNLVIVKPSENTSMIAYKIVSEFIDHIREELKYHKEANSMQLF